MSLINKIFQILRVPVAPCGSKIPRDLVAPAGVVGVFCQGHELQMGISHIPGIGNKRIPQLPVGKPFFPTAQMHLVYVHGRFVCIWQMVQIVLIRPRVGCRGKKYGGSTERLGFAGVGICFENDSSKGSLHGILVFLPFPGIAYGTLPETVGATVHGGDPLFPVVKVAHHADGAGPRGPKAEYPPVCFQMTSQKLPCPAGSSLIKGGSVHLCKAPFYKLSIHSYHTTICLCCQQFSGLN